jgi:hypothetical protein
MCTLSPLVTCRIRTPLHTLNMQGTNKTLTHTHYTLYTLHHNPYTLHPTPCTLHPTPYTLHPTLYALRPTPVHAGHRHFLCCRPDALSFGGEGLNLDRFVLIPLRT